METKKGRISMRSYWTKWNYLLSGNASLSTIHDESVKTNDLVFYGMVGPGELGEDIGLFSNNRVPIMGYELQDSVHADSGEYAFRL